MAVDLNTVQQLPLEGGQAFQTFGTTLLSTSYVINLRWNTRDAAWYFDLLDQNESVIVSGIKIVLGVELGRRTTDQRMPKGVFWAGDLSGQGLDATLFDLGTRVVVYFYPFAAWFDGV
jgi:hypothetical protein